MKRTMTVAVFVFFAVPALLLAASDPGKKDVLRFGTPDLSVPGKAIVPIIAVNDEPVTAMSIPLKFGNAGDAITLDKVEFPAESRVGEFDFKVTNKDNENKTVLIGLVSSGFSMKPAMDAGDDAIGYLHFTVSNDAVKEINIDIDASRAPQHTLTFIENRDVNGGKEVIDFQPGFEKGNIPLSSAGVKALPTAYALNGNFPNPFNPKTRIAFALPKTSKVSLEIYNILGQKVRTLLNENMEAGYKSVEWDGTDDGGVGVSSGVYLYKLKANEFSRVAKMTFLK
jgi:hypothetical protein